MMNTRKSDEITLNYQESMIKFIDDDSESNLDDDCSISSEEESKFGACNDNSARIKSIQEIFEDASIWDTLMVYNYFITFNIIINIIII